MLGTSQRDNILQEGIIYYLPNMAVSLKFQKLKIYLVFIKYSM